MRLTILLILTFFSQLQAQQADIYEDFDDGNDQGWTRMDPIDLAGFGPIASFNFPNGAYQISTLASPSEEQLGPSRGGALRLDKVFTDSVYLSVDLKIPDPQLRQAVGFLAMVQPDIGPGTTDGYSINWQPAENDLIINHIIDEQPTRLILTDLTGLPDFAGGQRLTVAINAGIINATLFNLSNLQVPIAQASAPIPTNNAPTSGTAGLFIFSDTDNVTGTTDAIFDNYLASSTPNPTPPPPPSPIINRDQNGQLQLTFPSYLLVSHELQSSPSLGSNEAWIPVPQNNLTSANGTTTLTIDPATPTSGRNFFRLRRATE